LLSSIARTKFSADLSPMRSRLLSSSLLSWNRSDGSATLSSLTSCSMSLAPRPSMSSALRATKCFSASARCALQ
jgi:hypothetical protein